MARHKTLLIALAALFASPAVAQDEAAESEARARAMEYEVAQPEAGAEAIELQMREAEERLADAAARVAELSGRRLPAVVDIERHVRQINRPVLGVTIGASEEDGPVEGVTIRGVTPGSAAADAGLRAGDVITSVNGESMSAEKDSEANDKLLDFMQGIDNGDTLDIEYLRDGDDAAVEVEPRPMSAFAFAFPGRGNWHVPTAPAAPNARWFGFYTGGGGWGDMEMVSLTEDLGRYFGTDTGLLVVRAPTDEKLQLQDGDVIQSIDGRTPISVSHAMRILGSYQSGEKLDIEIMRDKKRQTLSVEMPDHRQGSVRYQEYAAPPVESGHIVIRNPVIDVRDERI